jgi:branched-chain amino acid transport system substrate-binding protein
VRRSPLVYGDRPERLDHLAVRERRLDPAAYAQTEGVTRMFVTHDRESYGEGLARMAAEQARERGLEVIDVVGIDPSAANYRSLASRIATSGANGFLFGGISFNNAAQLWRDVDADNPDLKMFAGEGVADSEFAEGIGGAADDTFITVLTLPPDRYSDAAKRVSDRLARQLDREPSAYGIYGYDAMAVALQAIENTGGDRSAVVDAFFAIRDRRSLLGTYGIDDNGDTTLDVYRGYRINRGSIVFDRKLRPRRA